ncbi:origin recognition complex subunit 2 [Nilaparvata lugens]|uniref:origin recognition complex subunit 2 n=1 Tax=Nilaparvata lugens TaxID=108931 RepID=UPI00193D4E13|nr:origin recognition complex subunit 2 [Nilaparvata lugens]
MANNMKYQNKRKQRENVVVEFIDDSEVNHILPIEDLRLKMGSKRMKHKALGNGKSDTENSPLASRKKRFLKKDQTNDSDEDDDDDYSLKKDIRPAALFEDGDVAGKVMFGFHTPKKKNAMIEKARLSSSKTTPKHSPRTPQVIGLTPKTRRSILATKEPQSVDYSSPGCLKRTADKRSVRNPLTKSRRSIMWNDDNIKETSSPRSKNVLKEQNCDSSIPDTKMPSTPYNIRTRLKSKIAAKVMESDSEESDVDLPSSDSDSDKFKSSESSSSDDSDNENAEQVPAGKKLDRVYSDSTRKKGRDLTYAISVDDYFSSTSSKKNKTSNHTLSKLKSPRINEDQLAKLLKRSHSQCTHTAALQSLHKLCISQHHFDSWCFYLREGFSVLLYGLGSKKFILDEFHQKVLTNEYVLVINGFFPGLSTKEIADSLAELLNMKDVPSQLNEVVEMLEISLSRKSSPDIFLIVHNLDGVMLQSDKAQSFLSSLARLPKCHLLASIDHINAPLMWDDKKLSNYNFIWEDSTNYNPYFDETSFENSLLVKNTGGLVLSSLKSVYQSLTKNGKDIFKLLVEDHLANKKNKKYSGLGFSELYWKCRDNFLVSTDLALRSQLTEFLDHQILKWRRDCDHLFIPIDSTLLEQFASCIEEQGI